MCLQVSFSPQLYPARFPAPWAEQQHQVLASHPLTG